MLKKTYKYLAKIDPAIVKITNLAESNNILSIINNFIYRNHPTFNQFLH